MKSSDFNKALTSKNLKENLIKQFGTNVDLKSYSREQLEDIRNQFRTRVFQHENQAGYNELLTNETYQKDKAILQLLNTRIKEMLGEDIKKLKDKLVAIEEAKKGVKAPKFMKHAKGSKGADQDGDGKKGEFDDVQVARMVAGGVPKKKAIAKATSDNFKEGAGEADDTNRPAAKKKETTWTDKSGKQHTATRVQGSRSVAADKDADKERKSHDKDMSEAEDKCNHTPKGKKCPVHGLKECGMYEASHQAKTTMKHVKNPTPGEKKAAKDIKPGVKGYSDRAAMLKSAEADGRLKEGLPMVKGPDGKMVPKFAADGKGKKDLKSKKMDEAASIFRRHVRIVNESLAALLAEDEEGKAKAITAAGDMVNDYTSWMQRVGQYQTKSMIELADAIRADFGAAEAETFKQAVGPALSATLEVLTQQREAISNAVAVLAGEAAPTEPMGMEPEMGPEEPGLEPSEPDMMNEPSGDELAASEPAATGREMRESQFAKKLAESHSIISKLAR